MGAGKRPAEPLNFGAGVFYAETQMDMTAHRKKLLHKVNVREMRVDDIPAVYRLGQRLFQSKDATTLYRTWDAFEVTNNFNQDPHLSLVAESAKGRILGFALGTTYENESGGWRYGYFLWMGVAPRWQRSGLGAQLYHEMERRMHQDGVRMSFVDTAKSNAGAIKFFKKMGHGKPEAEVWMSKVIQRTRKPKDADKLIRAVGRNHHPRVVGGTLPGRKRPAVVQHA